MCELGSVQFTHRTIDLIITTANVWKPSRADMETACVCVCVCMCVCGSVVYMNVCVGAYITCVGAYITCVGACMSILTSPSVSGSVETRESVCVCVMHRNKV